MKKYYRLMLGRKSINAEECFAGNFVGADFGIAVDLNVNLPEEWREFNKTYIPIFLKSHPEKSKIAAGLACGPFGQWPKDYEGRYPSMPRWKRALPCLRSCRRLRLRTGRRAATPPPVHWLPQSIDRAEMSEA